MILCGNVFVDELKNTFILSCVLCKKKSRRYTEFTSHIKSKHKDFKEKEATPPRPIVKKIKDEEDEPDDENKEPKPEVDVEIKDEMDIDGLEEIADTIKYDANEAEVSHERKLMNILITLFFFLIYNSLLLIPYWL